MASLLSSARGSIGDVAIPPVGAVRVQVAGIRSASGSRSYVDDDAPIVRTVLPGVEGELEVIDLEARDGRIVRILRATHGVVDVDVVIDVAHGHGRDVSAWSGGVVVDGVTVHTGRAIDGLTGRLRLHGGEVSVVVIGDEPLSVDGAHDVLDRTLRSWRSRLAPVAYDGPYPRAVRRSLVTLLALEHARAAPLFAAVGLEEEADQLTGALLDAENVETTLRLGWREELRPLVSRLADAGDDEAVDDKVASRLTAWWVLDRAAQLAVARNPLDLDAVAWRVAARENLSWIDAHGLASDGGLRADASEADLVDVSLLQVAWRNAWPHEPWRAERTVDRVLRRVPLDALAPAFDAVRALARLRRWDDAHERMEALLPLGGPLGLFAENTDGSGEFPHPTAHAALVEAALALGDGPA